MTKLFLERCKNYSFGPHNPVELKPPQAQSACQQKESWVQGRILLGTLEEEEKMGLIGKNDI